MMTAILIINVVILVTAFCTLCVAVDINSKISNHEGIIDVATRILEFLKETVEEKKDGEKRYDDGVL